MTSSDTCVVRVASLVTGPPLDSCVLSKMNPLLLPPARPAEPGFAGAPPHEGYVFWVQSPCGLDAHTFGAVRARDPCLK